MALFNFWILIKFSVIHIVKCKLFLIKSFTFKILWEIFFLIKFLLLINLMIYLAPQGVRMWNKVSLKKGVEQGADFQALEGSLKNWDIPLFLFSFRGASSCYKRPSLYRSTLYEIWIGIYARRSDQSAPITSVHFVLHFTMSFLLSPHLFRVDILDLWMMNSNTTTFSWAHVTFDLWRLFIVTRPVWSKYWKTYSLCSYNA